MSRAIKKQPLIIIITRLHTAKGDTNSDEYITEWLGRVEEPGFHEELKTGGVLIVMHGCKEYESTILNNLDLMLIEIYGSKYENLPENVAILVHGKLGKLFRDGKLFTDGSPHFRIGEREIEPLSYSKNIFDSSLEKALKGFASSESLISDIKGYMSSKRADLLSKIKVMLTCFMIELTVAANANTKYSGWEILYDHIVKQYEQIRRVVISPEAKRLHANFRSCNKLNPNKLDPFIVFSRNLPKTTRSKMQCEEFWFLLKVNNTESDFRLDHERLSLIGNDLRSMSDSLSEIQDKLWRGEIVT